MCGIAGFLDFSCTSDEQTLLHQARDMASALRHRGPDAAGEWAQQEAGIALGHRRLAIIDLSESGAQPMHSHGGRFVLTYNGEIYNFLELRAELEASGASFRGSSDTEVMLEAFGAWGLEGALKRFVGMFAFALWDREQRILHLARDRAGEKPLYYGRFGSTLLFASELQALRRHPAWQGRVDMHALGRYLRRGYVPAPLSIYQGVAKLPPACFVSIPLAGQGELFAPTPYWSMAAAAEQGALEPFSGSDDEAVAELERLLRRSVKQQMLSDVPLGAFLSGGVDSSTIVALMQAQSERPVKTFTVGFWEKDFNEAEHAKAVAAHLGTEHTEIYVTAQQALDVVPKLPQLYDEPFADFSQIPTHLIAAVARKHVTVCLSADAGDEFFLGYNSYFWTQRLWERTRRLPGGARSLFRGLALPPAAAWNLMGRILGQEKLAHRAALLAHILPQPSPEAMFMELETHWKPGSGVLAEGDIPLAAPPDEVWRLPHYLQRLQYMDAVDYLPDDILVKVDRAAMGVSLESRAPLLDHRVVEFAWRAPLELKLRNGQGKWLLRQVLYKYVPQELVERPKMGFSVPMAQWLRGPLREWGETLLDRQRLAGQGFFSPDVVRKVWGEHQRGARDWKYLLWDVLMFQAWLEQEETLQPPATSAKTSS